MKYIQSSLCNLEIKSIFVRDMEESKISEEKGDVTVETKTRIRNLSYKNSIDPLSRKKVKKMQPRGKRNLLNLFKSLVLG
jgi:hypothetical protein